MAALSDAIEKAGGANEAAKICGVSVRAIYKWMAAGSLPRTEYTGETKYASLLAAAAVARGNDFSADELLQAALPRKHSVSNPAAA